MRRIYEGLQGFFVSDATAADNADHHLASLKNLAYGFAYMANTEFLIRSLSCSE